MNIGIYIEPAGSGIGGAEFCAVALAEALAGEHRVTIVHHKTGLSPERLARFFDADLGGVAQRHVTPEPDTSYTQRNPWRRYRAARAWHADLSAPYDVFVNITHGPPPFCHARRGILIVLFPFIRRYDGKTMRGEHASLRERLKNIYHDWEWRGRFAGYQRKTAISEFTRTWTRQWWHIDCEIVYPPVETDFGSGDKQNAVLSVGRFTTVAHRKNQRELVRLFREKTAPHLPDWTYRTVGGLGDLPEDRSYFEAVLREAEGGSTQVLANVERPALRGLYEHAKIFWHASGYDQDTESDPEKTEHFGIATVEAMAAGCVPVVVNRGGQPEIVEHGVSGFVWNTLDELSRYTLVLARDEPLRARMAEAARERAERFSRAAFVRRCQALLADLA